MALKDFLVNKPVETSTPVEKSIISYITEEILDSCQSYRVTPSHPLLEDSFLDSTGLQQLLTFIEVRYSITIADEDLVPENFSNVRALAHLVERTR